MSVLHSRYKKYVSDWKEGNEAGVLSLTSFSMKLENDDGANANYQLKVIGEKHRTKHHMTFRWNIPDLVAGFKKLNLLDDNFEYKPAGSCAPSFNSISKIGGSAIGEDDEAKNEFEAC